MLFIWKNHFDKYLMYQRNHKHFTNEMLEKLIRTQQKDIKVIDSFLKSKPLKVLDIGCGLGIYDLAIYDYFNRDNNLTFYLLDKTTSAAEEKNIHYGYRPVASFYNNLDYTTELLNINGIPKNNIQCISVDNEIAPCNQPALGGQGDLTLTTKKLAALSEVDLVISIISWGYHYPISTYLDVVYKILKSDGLLCLHCRDKDDLALLQTKFTILYPDTSTKPIRLGSFIMCRKK